jgi:hypothetical protein
MGVAEHACYEAHRSRRKDCESGRYAEKENRSPSHIPVQEEIKAANVTGSEAEKPASLVRGEELQQVAVAAPILRP